MGLPAEPGEQVLFLGHPSWRSMIVFYVKGILASVLVGAVVGVVTASASGGVRAGWVAIAVGVGFAAVMVRGLLARRRTTYMITDRRLSIGTGLLSREVHETRLERIQNVSTRQTVLERVLGVGTVDFDTAAGSDYDFSFAGIARPREVVRTVDRALRDLVHAGPGV